MEDTEWEGKTHEIGRDVFLSKYTGKETIEGKVDGNDVTYSLTNS